MRYSISVLVLALTSALFASQKTPLEELQHKIETSHGGKQANFLMQLAHLQAQTADQLYQNGDSENGLANLQSSTASANEATSVALDSGKRLKDTEIELRKLSDRMQTIRQNANFEDRRPIDQLIQNIEQDRNKLLDRMFKK